MNSWQEDLAKIAQGDQDQAARAKFAQMLRTHYDGLLVAGFTEPQATYLTERYQSAMRSPWRCGLRRVPIMDSEKRVVPPADYVFGPPPKPEPTLEELKAAEGVVHRLLRWFGFRGRLPGTFDDGESEVDEHRPPQPLPRVPYDIENTGRKPGPTRSQPPPEVPPPARR